MVTAAVANIISMSLKSTYDLYPETEPAVTQWLNVPLSPTLGIGGIRKDIQPNLHPSHITCGHTQRTVK